jgi:hypothetical protein
MSARRVEISPIQNFILHVEVRDKDNKVVFERTKGPESGQLAATVPALLGAHSEAQIIATLAAGDRLTATLTPSPPYSLLLTGFQGDAAPQSIYVTALVHPDIIPHAGYISPLLCKIVHDNLQIVMPLIRQGQSARFIFENRTATSQDLEAVVGLIVGFDETLMEIRKRRLTI